MFDSGFKTTVNVLVVPGLPENVIFGLDWQKKISMSINLDEDSGKCFCESKKAQLKSSFISQAEYQRKLDAEASKMLKQSANSIQSEKFRRTFVTFAEELSIFDLRSNPGKALEKDRR